MAAIKDIPAETKHRSNGLVSFGADVRKIVSPILGRKGFVQADLTAHWQDILGDALAQGVFPVSLSFSKSDKERTLLTVGASSGAFAMAFESQKKQIAERIRSYFGYAAVTDFKIVQGYAPVVSLKKETKKRSTLSETERAQINDIGKDIENPELKQAVQDLIASL